MRFKCGKTDEEIVAEWEWHDWFAWYPVSVSRGKCVWFETIQRRKAWEGNPDIFSWVDWNYKFKD